MRHLHSRNYTNIVAYSGAAQAWMAERDVEQGTGICAYTVSAYSVVALALYPAPTEDDCAHVVPLILIDGRVEDIVYYNGVGGDHLYLGMSESNIWPTDVVEYLFSRADAEASVFK